MLIKENNSFTISSISELELKIITNGLLRVGYFYPINDLYKDIALRLFDEITSVQSKLNE